MLPILFETKFFTLHTLWLFFAAALIIGTYYFLKFSVRNSLKIKFINDHIFAIFISMLVGARIFGIIYNYQAYFLDFGTDNVIQIFKIWDGGLNGWGGLIGIAIGFYLLCKKHDQDFFKWGDTFIPATILGLSIYHIGTFFDGRNYGNETSLPWGVNFENITVKYTVPIHPTQTYAALYSIAIAIALIIMLKNKKVKEIPTGTIALTGTILYGCARFLEEFVRGDDTILLFNSIRLPQLITLLITILAGISLYFRYNHKKIK